MIMKKLYLKVAKNEALHAFQEPIYTECSRVMLTQILPLMSDQNGKKILTLNMRLNITRDIIVNQI